MVTTELNAQLSPALVTSYMNSSLDKLTCAEPCLLLAAREWSVMGEITLLMHLSQGKHCLACQARGNLLLETTAKSISLFLPTEGFRTHLTADPKLTIQLEGESSPFGNGQGCPSGQDSNQSGAQPGRLHISNLLPPFLQSSFDRNFSPGRVRVMARSY